MNFVGMVRGASWVALGLMMTTAACGGSQTKGADSPSATADGGTPADNAPQGSTERAGNGATASAPGSAPAAGAASPEQAAAPAEPPVEHPFVKGAVEATSRMNDAIDTKSAAVGKCVEAYRARAKDPAAKVSVKVGIDQEGTLIAVAPAKSGTLDKELTDCLLAALKRAPFPRSNAGVITVTKTFENVTVYR